MRSVGEGFVQRHRAEGDTREKRRELKKRAYRCLHSRASKTCDTDAFRLWHIALGSRDIE